MDTTFHPKVISHYATYAPSIDQHFGRPRERERERERGKWVEILIKDTIC